MSVACKKYILCWIHGLADYPRTQAEGNHCLKHMLMAYQAKSNYASTFDSYLEQVYIISTQVPLTKLNTGAGKYTHLSHSRKC